MSSAPLQAELNRALSRVRWRVVASWLRQWLPLLIASTLLAWRLHHVLAIVWLAAGALTLLAGCVWRLRYYDRRWLTRRLNALRPDLDDSAELVWDADDDPDDGPTLRRLQAHRVVQRLSSQPLPSLAPPWPRRRMLMATSIALLLTALSLSLPYWSALWSARERTSSSSAAAIATVGGIDARITVQPPAYTGLDPRRERTLDLRVPERSQVQWSLAFAREPASAALVFDDGSRVPLTRSGGRWNAARTVEAAMLYRIEAPGADTDDVSYRLDVIVDRAPEITVRAPERTLSVIDAAQPQWQLSFEARDDYALGDAELSIALAQGSGESIEVTQRNEAIVGDGNARERRYQRTLDLAALGFAQGDDLIVRLSVSDRREPEPNRARSASFILRWPPEPSSDSAGMDGLVKKTMPAYFRSQRQIIIDTEALIAARGQLDADEFEQRASAIGVDQRLLRLRYGQFLGEEAEGDELAAPGDSEHHDEDAAPDEPPPGSSDAVLHEFGHTHDIEEAATLLDDATRTLLRAALGEMWSAEGQLRTAQPEAALPHELRALDAIKQVQQSTRIYLARVGQDLPPVDETRRLTGERAGLVDPPPPATPVPVTSEPARAWQALQQGTTPDIDAIKAWVRDHADAVPDRLTLLRDVERVGRDPRCRDCRDALAAQLWPLLPPAGTALQPRAAPDARAATYLQALPAAASAPLPGGAP